MYIKLSVQARTKEEASNTAASRILSIITGHEIQALLREQALLGASQPKAAQARAAQHCRRGQVQPSKLKPTHRTHM